MTKHLLKTPDERKQPSISTGFAGRQVSSGNSLLGRASSSARAAASTKDKGGGAVKWAVTELLDVSDFDALVPRPAHRFPFTLDGFQKQAVARLEVKRNEIINQKLSEGCVVVPCGDERMLAAGVICKTRMLGKCCRLTVSWSS